MIECKLCYGCMFVYNSSCLHSVFRLYAPSLVLNVSLCQGTKLCMTYFPTHLKLTPFTPAWQRAPAHVVVNNSDWPSAPLTFACYELIMTSSVMRLINLCETQNLKDYYDDFCFCCCIVILFISRLCSCFEGWRGRRFCFALSKNIYIQVMTEAVLMGKTWKLLLNYFGRAHVRSRVDKVWHF